MASRNEIIARTEKIDQTMREFSEALRKFSVETKSHNDKMKSIVQGAGSGWEGETYNAFVEMMEKELASIAKETVHADTIAQTLDEKADRLSQALDLIRKGGS